MFGARPRSATHTTGNSRPLAAWMLIRRTASAVGQRRRVRLARPCLLPSGRRRGRGTPAGRGPRSSSKRRARRASLWALASSPGAARCRTSTGPPPGSGCSSARAISSPSARSGACARSRSANTQKRSSASSSAGARPSSGPAADRQLEGPPAPLLGGEREQRQGVAREPHRAATASSRVQRHLVQRIGEHAQVGEQVFDLLALPVARRRRRACARPCCCERPLVHGDVARARAAARRPRRRAPPRRRQLRHAAGRAAAPRPGARARRAAARRRSPAARRQPPPSRPSAVSSSSTSASAVAGVPSARAAAAARREAREALLEDGADRRPPAAGRLRKLRVSARLAPRREQQLGALAEDRHLGVPEAVDRLELVPDGEQVLALERAQDLELAAVGVLELVHHQQLEALRPRICGRLRARRAARAPAARGRRSRPPRARA